MKMCDLQKIQSGLKKWWFFTGLNALFQKELALHRWRPKSLALCFLDHVLSVSAGVQRALHLLPGARPTAQQRLPIPRVRHPPVPGLAGAERPLQPHGHTVPAEKRRSRTGQRLRSELPGRLRIVPFPTLPHRRAVRLPHPHAVRHHRHPHSFRHPVLRHQMSAAPLLLQGYSFTLFLCLSSVSAGMGWSTHTPTQGKSSCCLLCSLTLFFFLTHTFLPHKNSKLILSKY